MCARQHTFCVPITESGVSHIRQLDVTFRARVHEEVTVLWMKLCSGDDFCELLHVDRLDVHYVLRKLLSAERSDRNDR